MADAVSSEFARVAVEPGAAPNTFDSNSERYEIATSSLKAAGSIIRPNTITGTRSRQRGYSRRGPYTIGGSLNGIPCSPYSLRQWCERVMGGSVSTSGQVETLTLGSTLPPFGVMVDAVANLFRYDDCVVSSLVIEGSVGGEVTMTPQILAKGFSDSGLTFPSVDLDYSTDQFDPFVLSDIVLSIGGSSYEFGQFRIGLNNNANAITRNSLTPNQIRPGVRTNTLEVNPPYNTAAHTAFEEPDLDGLAGTLTLTNGNVSATFTLPNLQRARNAPDIPNRSEINFDLAFDALATDTTDDDEVTLAIDSTPGS